MYIWERIGNNLYVTGFDKTEHVVKLLLGTYIYIYTHTQKKHDNITITQLLHNLHISSRTYIELGKQVDKA